MWDSKRKKKKTLTLKIAIFFIFSLVAILFLLRYFLFYPLRSWMIKRMVINPLSTASIKNNRKAKINTLQNKTDEIKNLLAKAKISNSSVSLATDSSYLIQLEEGGEVVFSSKKSIESQVSSLQLILSRLTIEGKAIKELDLRFDRPIVVVK